MECLCPSVHPLVSPRRKVWITYIQAYMPHESSEDSSNQPDGPMGSHRCPPLPTEWRYQKFDRTDTETYFPRSFETEMSISATNRAKQNKRDKAKNRKRRKKGGWDKKFTGGISVCSSKRSNKHKENTQTHPADRIWTASQNRRWKETQLGHT